MSPLWGPPSQNVDLQKIQGLYDECLISCSIGQSNKILSSLSDLLKMRSRLQNLQNAKAPSIIEISE